MVTPLRRPTLDHSTYVEQVVAERQAGANAAYFAGIQDWWKERLQGYIERAGNPEQIAAETEVAPHRDKFNNLYRNCDETSVHGAALKALRDAKPQFCPACGEAGQPNTLDHYLPKTTFPEFAIAPINLFPMCDTCQGFKGSLTTDENGRRWFIHPYFDDFLGQPLLSIDFRPPFEAPVMTLQVCATLEAMVYALTMRHVQQLQIERRFQHFMKDEFSRLLRLPQDSRQEDGDVRDDLHTFARHAQRRGINLWDSIWYASVLANADLVSYLAEGDLPQLR